MIDVPLPLVGFGMAVAAGLGYLAGRLSRRPDGPSVLDEDAADAVLASAFERLSTPRFALVLRVDAVATWKRTHGATALDLFVRRLRQALEETLPDAVNVQTGDAEVTAVCDGEPQRAAVVLDALKARRFRLPSGVETLVTCSLGTAAEEPGVTIEDLRSRAAAAVRAAQESGRWQAFTADSRGTRAL